MTARVLIGCQHADWSCDLLPADTPTNRHIVDDVRLLKLLDSGIFRRHDGCLQHTAMPNRNEPSVEIRMASYAIHSPIGTGQCRMIPGYPKYLARDDGEIISLQKKRPKVLKRRPHRSGYVMVTVCEGCKQHTTVAHRLIAAAFHPNPKRLPCVRHIDGDKQNNAPDNLVWGTYSDNERDKIAHGRRRYGTANMKLNKAARKRIEELFASGTSRKDLAVMFDVDRSTISRFLAGYTWKNRKWPMAKEAAER